ncbi:arginyltransferase [Methylomagnum ishizawai]|uniref:arginyltransferase n=1 Tax=Methylomagnum ishizawai TaxID=1760988 RepID=UPI001C3421CB|nr:arginyltransferase [Methylomagnum ishizawai]BBL75184.1 putative arginyl-tRNA--protein transferase [Methylomagnum ishizawai]
MKSIPLYLGYEHDCDYLPGRRARMAYVSPRVALDPVLYTRLAASGFRRSGDLVYRPHCLDCSACIPVRIPVARFQPSRAQRRVAKLNADLRVVRKYDVFDERHYRLYMRYLESRHADGHMALSSPEDYIQFVGSDWGDTGLYEFLEGDELRAVAVVDHLSDGLSAVYTFYDPGVPRRSLGTQAVLWQIDEARRRGLPWVYLGFWISGCRKMAYKDAFRPFEVLREGGWTLWDGGGNAQV